MLLRGRSRKTSTETSKIAKKKTCDTERRKAQKRDYQRRVREELKRNPQQHELVKRKDRERKRKAAASGKVPKRSQLNHRELRLARRNGRIRVKEHRERKKRNMENAKSCTQAAASSNSNRHAAVGRRVKKRQEKRCNRVLKKKNKEVLVLKRKLWAIQKRLQRKTSSTPVPELSPDSRISKLAQGKQLPLEVKKELKFSFALQSELKYSASQLSGDKEKRVMSRLVSGRVLKRYRLLNKGYGLGLYCLKQMRQARKGQLTSQVLCSRLNATRAENHESNRVKDAVINFFRSDTASSISPYKKESTIVSGEVEQRRFLNDSLRVLYRAFIRLSQVKASYSTFCKYRPEWVVSRKLSGRDTCLCILCENFKLLFAAAKNVKILNSRNVSELVLSLCCSHDESCLLGMCPVCMKKEVQFLPCQDNAPVRVQKWERCKETRYSAKQKDLIEVKITKKTDSYVTILHLKLQIQESLDTYVKHLGRIEHQRNSVKELKNSLKAEDMFFNIDWSEDYQGKWGREPQSTHFGGSHPFFSLHTGRMYSRDLQESFCTVSDVTRHDPQAIVAHIIPVLSEYLGKQPQVSHLHFLSDGPVTQYKNTKLYYLLTQHVAAIFPQITHITWNFSESGHGKNEADGVGGTAKTMLDKFVGLGNDVVTLDSVENVLRRKCPSVRVITVPSERIEYVDSLPIPPMTPVKETLKMHQYKWNRAESSNLSLKYLSCYSCDRLQVCEHFAMKRSEYLIPGNPLTVRQEIQRNVPVSREMPENVLVSRELTDNVSDIENIPVSNDPIMRKRSQTENVSVLRDQSQNVAVVRRSTRSKSTRTFFSL